MNIENKKTYLGIGKTKDIANNVFSVYEEYKNQTAELVKTLKGNNIQRCKAVFDYIIANVRYIADPSDQLIKTPARLIADGVGDCKSFSIFAASCLYNMQIPHRFRFVSYDNENYTHVFVVADDELGNEIIIDPVERKKGNMFCSVYQGNPIFNDNRPYKKKIDMEGSKMYKLSGIEDFTLQKPPKIDVDNTRAENYIYSKINAYMAQAMVATGVDKITALANMDRWLVALNIYRLYLNNETQLAAFGKLVEANEVVFAGSGDWNDRATQVFQLEKAFLVELDPTTMEKYEDFEIVLPNKVVPDINKRPIYVGNTETFEAEWNTYVIDDNKNEVSAADKAAYKAKLSTTTSISDLIYEYGIFFLYLFLTEEELEQANETIKNRYDKELEVYNYIVSKAYGFYSEQTVWNMIYTACTIWQGKPPRQTIEELKAGNKWKIGEPVTTVALITAIATGIAAIIAALVPLFTDKTLTEPSNITVGVPLDSDWNGLVSTSSSNNLLLLAAGAAALYFVFKKDDKKTTKKQKPKK